MSQNLLFEFLIPEETLLILVVNREKKGVLYVLIPGFVYSKIQV